MKSQPDGSPPAREPAAEAGPETAPPAGATLSGRVVAALLLAAAVLDLARCGAAAASVQHALPTIGLVGSGLGAAGLSLRTARACASRRPWAIWAALAIGAASGPQAAVSGFRPPYAIFDTATAALGILLVVAVLATAGGGRPADDPGQDPN